VLISGLKIRVK